MAGYHLKDIPRGEIGELSKIKEELLELEDAMEQSARIMALVELSDLYGAMECFLQQHFPDMSMDDLERMSTVTKRAFSSCARLPRSAHSIKKD